MYSSVVFKVRASDDHKCRATIALSMEGVVKQEDRMLDYGPLAVHVHGRTLNSNIAAVLTVQALRNPR